jgi:GT2 family glycosyltransferase
MQGTDADTPEITVIVVNYNGGELLRGCMASLAAQTFKSFEAILVDNASTDGSVERIVEKPERLTILHQTRNHGFAAGNNLAAKHARGQWIALLNPDAEAMPDWLESVIKAVEARPNYRVVASLQVSMMDPARLDGAGDCYLAYGYAWRGGFGYLTRSTPGAGQCFGPCGAAAFYPRELFLEAGGFDETYFCYHEDVDLAFRLRLLGEKCQFVPKARIVHAGSAITGRGSDFATFHGIRNGVWTYFKNMPSRLLIVTFPVWLLGMIALLVRGLFRGVFIATLKGFLCALGDLGPSLRARADLKRKRVASVGSIAAMLNWNPLAYLSRAVDVRSFRD